MPIVVSYQPDAALLARAGYVAGAGEFAQQQREFQQRERMQMRALESNQISQRIAQDAAMNRLLVGGRMDMKQQAMFEQQRNMANRRIKELDNEGRMEELKEDWKQRQQQAMIEGENVGNGDVVKFLVGQAEDRLEAIRDKLSQGYTFSPEDQRQWDALQKELGVIKADPNTTGSARAQAFYEKTFRNPIPDMIAPKLQDSLEDRTGKITLPDGREVTVGEARDITVIDDGKPEKESTKPKSPMEMFRSDPATFRDVMKLAIETLTIKAPINPLTGKATGQDKPPTPQEAARWAVDYIREAEALLTEEDIQDDGSYDIGTGVMQ